MALDLSNLPDFKKQDGLPILTKIHYGFKTAQVLKNKVAGIKGTQSLTNLDITASFQDGSVCGWNPAGTTTYTQRDLTVGQITMQEALCIKAERKKWLSIEMEAGAKGDEVIPYGEYYINEKTKLAQEKLEKAVWQGDTASGNADLNKFNGFIKHITGSTASTRSVTVTASTVTNANAYSIINGMIADMPQELNDAPEVLIFVGNAFYNAYVQNLVALNLYAQNPDEAKSRIVSHLGTNVKIVATAGIPNGLAFLSYNENFVLGFDLMSEETSIDVWFSKDNNEVRSQIDFAYGTQVAFPSQAVYWKTGV